LEIIFQRVRVSLRLVFSLNLFADSVKRCNNKKLFEAAVAGTLEITGEKFSPCTGGKPLNMAMYSGLKE